MINFQWEPAIVYSHQNRTHTHQQSQWKCASSPPFRIVYTMFWTSTCHRTNSRAKVDKKKEVSISISPHFVRLLFFYLLRWMSSHQPSRSSWTTTTTDSKTLSNTYTTKHTPNTNTLKQGQHKHWNRLTMRYTCTTTMYSVFCFGAAATCGCCFR